MKKKTKAVYPGTFDPVTNGHLSLIERGLEIFDEVIVAVSMSAGKNPFFNFEERIQLMKDVIEKAGLGKRVKVVGFDGLTATLAKDHDVKAIIRGLRAVSDFEYEFQMALMNRKLAHDVETVFLMPALSWVYLSSTIVKDVASHGGEIKDLVPTVVKKAMKKKLGRKK